MSQTLKITEIKKCVTRCWLYLNHCLNRSHYFHFHSESIWRASDVSPLGTEEIYIILLYIFFWVFPRRQIVVGRRFGTLYQFHLQRLGVECILSYSDLLKST